MNSVFQIAKKIVTNRTFTAFIFILILLSAIIIGIETYSGIAAKHRLILVFLDKFIILCFTLEIGLKKKFWKIAITQTNRMVIR
jgi:voltage-gated sodium channel